MNKKVLVMISPVSVPRINGVAHFAREHGWHLMIQDRLGHRPLAWDGDGVITAVRSDEATTKAVRKFVARGIPVVDVTICRPEIKLPRVMSDHVQIGRMAAEHFAERNFRNLAWFSSGWGHVQELRYKGLTEKNQAARWIASESIPKSRQGNYSAFLKWIAARLKEAEKPLGVLTYDEADGAKLLYAAETAGISVPEELAILSIGNDPLLCENQPVPLSSIDQNLERGGYMAADLLDRLMNGEKPPAKPILIPPTGISLRRSTDIVASGDPIVKQTLAYIKANLTKPFGAQQIANDLGISRNQLDKHFRRDLNRSIGNEIMRQRLSKAKILLRCTKKPVHIIAKETGFCSPSHMNNSMRDHTGFTPRQYRNTFDT